MKTWLAISSMVLAGALAAAAQSSSPQLMASAAMHASTSSSKVAAAIAPSVFTLTKNVREVRVELSVTDALGHVVPSIDASAVQLYDNGSPVQQLTGFERASDAPLEIAILIDSSRSTDRELPIEKQMALQFLKETMRPDDRATIVGFGTHLAGVPRFTNQSSELEQQAAAISSDGLTALNDAIVTMCRDAFSEDATAIRARKVMVVITDGRDTVSMHSLDDAISEAIRAEVTIFTVSVMGRHSWVDDRPLKRMTMSTAGRAFYAKDLERVRGAFTGIDEALRMYFVATYVAPEAHRAMEFHRIDVASADRRLNVRAREGYFLRQ